MTVFECFSIISIVISSIHASISVWVRYEEQKKKALGRTLQFNCVSYRSPVSPYKNENPEITIKLALHNPTKQVIKVNNIWIDHKSPFQFIEARYINPNPKFPKKPDIIISTKPKHIDLINPQTKPESEHFFDLFSINSKQEIILSLTVLVKQPTTVNPITIILEHTSSNDPSKTLKLLCNLGFFKLSDEQNLNCINKLFKESAPQ
ncbi:hypothetical protein [Bartonella sp. WD16.2]|uniref:hypothetical protein n=1 Tax=Bartonella sp. WD16.2 TaxID=1933904 RepID=UPI00099A38E4|nr:hypothetical protein [Bartonella sp. WD16.2]AQX19762.1 hypothetical protein BWD162_006400 [Bartonella sp. WD16.2]